MKRNGHFKFVFAIIVFLFIASVVFVRPVLAQSGGGYDLTWNTIAGGGATVSTGGGYEMGGTIGQSDAGAQSGGTYALHGGFWHSVNALLKLYLPLILK
ncbi:MAG: hypothetical protein HZB51_06930 [Chloroflexi bacterium]|nr:hypothetical protein [Chloroflexota bacterium]